MAGAGLKSKIESLLGKKSCVQTFGGYAARLCVLVFKKWPRLNVIEAVSLIFIRQSVCMKGNS